MAVLDTNVVSELMRPAPDLTVEAWVTERAAATLYFSAVGEAELRYGVAVMLVGRRRDARTSPAAFCRSTARRRAPMRGSWPPAVLPGGRSLKPIVRSRPLRVRAAWR